MKHFLAVLFCMAAMGQIPFRQTMIEIYDRPNSTVRRQLLSSGTHDWYNVTGADRVNIASGGGLSTTVGSITGYTGAAGSETVVWKADSTGVYTNQTMRIFDATGDRVSIGAASSSFYNSTLASRVFISPAGGTSTTVGIVAGQTGAAGAETDVWRADSTGFFTNQAVRVIDGAGDRINLSAASSSFYNSALAQRVFISPAGGASSTVGIVAGYTGAAGVETVSWQANSTGFSTVGSFRALNASGWYAGIKAAAGLGANLEWNLPTADSAGCLVSDGAGNLSFTACSGAGSYVTTNTAQTIVSGADKDIESVFTWVSGGVDRVQVAAAQQTFWNSTGASRLFLASNGGTSTTVGSVRGYTGAAGSETIAWEGDSDGFSTYGDTRGYSFTNAGGQLLGTWRADTNGALLQMDYNASGTLKNRAMVTSTASTGLFDSYSDVVVLGVLTPTLTARVGSGTIQAQTMAFSDKIIGPSFYRAFTVPSSGSASITWTLPTTDASGCLQSNGSGVLSISTCPGGGVTSVTGSGVISSTGGTTPVISCPNCVDTNSAQTITAKKTIDDVTTIDFQDSSSVVTARLGYSQWEFGSGIIAGTGRGVRISNSGMIVTNTSGTVVITASTSGNMDAATYSSGGVAGVSGVCGNIVATNGLVTTCAP